MSSSAAPGRRASPRRSRRRAAERGCGCLNGAAASAVCGLRVCLATCSLSTNRVLQTRVGADPGDASKRQFVIDFGIRENGSSATTPPQAVVQCGENATVSNTQIFRNTFSESWRVIFSLKPKAGNKESVDIQCAVKRGAETLSETWKYLWNPPQPKTKSE